LGFLGDLEFLRFMVTEKIFHEIYSTFYLSSSSFFCNISRTIFPREPLFPLYILCEMTSGSHCSKLDSLRLYIRSIRHNWGPLSHSQKSHSRCTHHCTTFRFNPVAERTHWIVILLNGFKVSSKIQVFNLEVLKRMMQRMYCWKKVRIVTFHIAPSAVLSKKMPAARCWYILGSYFAWIQLSAFPSGELHDFYNHIDSTSKFCLRGMLFPLDFKDVCRTLSGKEVPC
jgi:hypothetical protein